VIGDARHADDLAVEDLERGQPGDRLDLLDRQRLAAHDAALELEHVVRAAELRQRLRAIATSPSADTNVNAVGPSRNSLSVSAPTSSTARSVSVFLTTLKRAPASISLLRSSAAWGTEMPR
jgi:hypothetical protein